MHPQASATVSSLARLSIVVPERHLETLMKVIRTQCAQFTARDVSGIMHSLASLGARPLPSALDPIGYRAHLLLQAQLGADVLEQSTDQPGSYRDTATTSNFSRAEDLTFSPQGISMLMHSAAVMGYANDQLLTSAADAAVRHLSGFTSQGLSNTIWALAKLEHYSPALVNATLACFRQRHAEFKPQEISNLMWALTQFRYDQGGEISGFEIAILSASLPDT